MRKFFFVVLTVVTVVTTLVYLLSCLTPFISPVDFWPMVLLELGFPYLALALLILILSWIFIKKNAAIALAVVLLVGYQNLAATIALSAGGTSKADNQSAIRVLSWNVRGFDNPADHADSINSTRRRIFRYIKQVDADVVCLQEFLEFVGPSFLSNVEAMKQLGYPFMYRPSEVDTEHSFGLLTMSNAIFSKVPLVNTGSQLLTDPSHPEHVIYADILLEGRPLRLMSCHYRSFYFNAASANPVVPFHYDSSFIYTASNFTKLKVIQQEHSKQAQLVRGVIDESPHPVLFAADMNSVPTSYAYHKTKGELRDAFLSRGNGLGGSMDSLPKTLRIDYLLLNKDLEVLRYNQDRLALSDHYPHFIEIRWKR